MDCRTVFSTVDQGHVHVASGTQYQGEINSYNWWLTKFVAWVLGWSTSVQVGNKMRSLDKKSYVQFLQEHGVAGATVKTISQFNSFNDIPSTRSTNKGTMLSHLSTEKVTKLTHKMICNLARNDTVRVTNLLGKGAEVNYSFWACDNDNKVIFSQRFSDGLPEQRIPPCIVRRLTPLLYASLYKRTEIANLLLAFGANPRFIGYTYNFSREILGVQNNSQLHATVDPVFVQRGGYPHRSPHLEVRNQVGLEVRTTQTVTYQDTLQQLDNLSLGADSQLMATPVLQALQTREWNSTDYVGRTRLF